jgi:uncharacterized repeat protein (TIGR03806 family)
MRVLASLVLTLATVGMALAVRKATADDAPAARPAPFLRGPTWTNSRVLGFPDPPPPLRIRRAFPELKFTGPVYTNIEPTSGRLFVVELKGPIKAFANRDDVTEVETVLDLRREVYSVCFHPRYAENGYVYVFSSGPGPNDDPAAVHRDDLPAVPPGDLRFDDQNKPWPKNRISRFQLPPHRTERTAADTEQIILEWSSAGHNGGDMAFGPDGYLYISAGDGTVGSDPIESAQDVTNLLATMIRIDVDHPEPGRPYRVPDDNPFLNHPGARPEIWAFGFRNPWRFSFDPASGDLWMGDIGQDAWEMIYLVRRGGNYGWAIQEGSRPFHPLRQRGPAEIVPPVFEHPHSEARSIVGGFVYHGDRFPDLRGAYIYGDYETGRIWALRWDGQQVTEHRELAATGVKFLSLIADAAGEIYLADYLTTGEVFRLEESPPPDASLPPFPTRLSETGLFADVAAHRPAAGLVPYEVNSPLWSDGALKTRFLALPGAATIDYQPTTAWGLPEGAVLVKTFELELERGNPAGRRRVETRLLTRTLGHWHGYSYAWNDQQTDAELVPAAGRDQAYSIVDAVRGEDSRQAEGSRQQVWHYPSRAECMMCHSRAAGFVLGLNTAQMNRDSRHGERVDNQIRWMDAHGLFSSPITGITPDYARLPDPADAAVDLEQRVRSYLHVNCAICHVVDGGGNARIVLDFFTPRSKMEVVGVRPIHDSLGVADPLLVAPGDPDRSLLLRRMTTLGPGRMPRLATSVVDEEAARMIADWIRSLDNP